MFTYIDFFFLGVFASTGDGVRASEPRSLLRTSSSNDRRSGVRALALGDGLDSGSGVGSLYWNTSTAEAEISV